MMLNLEQATQYALDKYASLETKSPDGLIDVEAELVELLCAEEWSDNQFEFFHGWMKKMDVTKAQYLAYTRKWKPSREKIKIEQSHLQLSALMALRYLQSKAIAQAGMGQKLKTINVMYKILDRVESVFTLKTAAINDFLSQMLQAAVVTEIETSEAEQNSDPSSLTLPITVLFSEGPIARAYLETIAAMGLKVNKIIRLVSSIDLVSRKPVGGILPKGMKVNYAANKQYKQMFYWPNFYQAKHADTVALIRSQIQEKFSFSSSCLQQGCQNKDLQYYSDTVESWFVTGLKDPQLARKLAAEQDQLFLFTGGGIVPASLLNLADKRLIHVHPGFLPEIRGADCVLWSQVLHQRMSASAFFMAPGIDVGDVLQACWLPQVHLNFPKDLDSRVKYRLIYGFLDPWVRSLVLQQLIRSTEGLTAFNGVPQSEDAGMTYHFMHEQLKQLAYEQFKSVG